MPIHRIAPLAACLIFAPCAIAQAPDTQPAAPRRGNWYVAASVGAVENAEYGYDEVLISDVLTSSSTVTTDSGAAIEAALGYAFSSGLRAEAALTLQKFGGAQTHSVFSVIVTTPPDTFTNTIAGDDIRSTALNLNAYYDFPMQGSIRPYVGIGAGIVSVEIDDGVFDAKDPGISLQAMAGFNVNVSKSLALYVEGRWQESSDLAAHGFDTATSLPITADFDFSTLSARAGLRLNF